MKTRIVLVSLGCSNERVDGGRDNECDNDQCESHLGAHGLDGRHGAMRSPLGWFFCGSRCRNNENGTACAHEDAVRGAADKQIVKRTVSVRAHHNVIGCDSLRLRQNVLNGTAHQLNCFCGYEIGLQLLLNGSEFPRRAFFSGDCDFRDVLHQRRILRDDRRRLDDGEQNNPTMQRAGESGRFCHDRVAYRREIDWGKDGFHAATVEQCTSTRYAWIGENQSNFGITAGGFATVIVVSDVPPPPATCANWRLAYATAL